MERREILMNCVGGASLILFPTHLQIRGGPKARESSDLNDLLSEMWAAYYTGCFRLDYGYPIPYFDHAWAQLPTNAGNSIRAVILEHRRKLLVLRDDAENSLPAHRAAVDAEPTNWEPRYSYAFALRRAGRNEEALNEYLTVAQMPACPHDCLSEIGWCYYRKGMYEEARRCFEKAKANDDDPIPIRHFSSLMLTLENRMLVYSKLGLRGQADQIAEEYVRRYGRIEYPERRALADIGIDADALYLGQYPFKA